MDLWQWVSFEDTQFQTWFARADVPELLIPSSLSFSKAKTLIKIGPVLEASCLVFPLVFGIDPQSHLKAHIENKKLPLHYTSGLWKIGISFRKEGDNLEDIMDREVSSIKALSVLGELINAVAEVTDQVGWNFISFTKAKASEDFSLLVSKSENNSLSEICRSVVLFRAALEILCFERGFKLFSVNVQMADNFIVDIDYTFIEKLSP